MARFSALVLMLLLYTSSWCQKTGVYYSQHKVSHFDSNPIAGFHITGENIYLLLKIRVRDDVYQYDLLSLTKKGVLIDSINTEIADTPLTGFFNLKQHLYGANNDVVLFYQQLDPDDDTWYASAVEKYNSNLERTMNWRGPTLRYSTVNVGTDGTITAFGLHKYGDLSRTIRINPGGKQVMDSNSRAIRTAWGLHRVEDSFYCFVNGRSIALLDSLGIVQDLETTEISNASETYLVSTVSLLTSDTALVVSYYADYEEHKNDGYALAKIDLNGKILWNWTPDRLVGSAYSAAALPNGGLAVGMDNTYEDLKVLDKNGNIIVQKHYEFSNQKKGNLGFRKVQFDPKDSTLWVAASTSEEFVGDTNSYKGVAILHLDMDGNLLDTNQNIEVTNVSISKVQRPIRVACYPNPTLGSLRLDLPEGVDYNYRIIDLMGKPYQQGTLQNGQAVDIETLNTGLFLIEVQNEDGFFFSSFIKD